MRVKKKLSDKSDISPFCRVTDIRSWADLGFVVTSALDFKARVDPLTCLFHHLYVIDSPLASWWPAWQLVPFPILFSSSGGTVGGRRDSSPSTFVSLSLGPTEFRETLILK